MKWLTKTRVKYALAGVGGVYLLLLISYFVYAGVKGADPVGPSELEAHPERQDEILAQRRAEELRGQLGLSDEQTQRIAQIYEAQKDSGPGDDSQADGDSRERRRQTHDQIDQVLTPEQKTALEQSRGQSRGPGGPRGQISPERIESIKEKMSPEQRQRFEKRIEQWQQRRQQRRGGQGPGGQGPRRRPQQ
jgi:hypothetical protein